MAFRIQPKILEENTQKLSNRILLENNYNFGFVTSKGQMDSEYGKGTGSLYLRDSETAPTENPTDGGLLYVENGQLKFRSPTGVITLLAA